MSKNNQLMKKDFVQYILSGNKIKFELGELKENGDLKLKIKVEDHEGYLEFPVKA